MVPGFIVCSHTAQFPHPAWSIQAFSEHILGGRLHLKLSAQMCSQLSTGEPSSGVELKDDQGTFLLSSLCFLFL